MDDVDFRGKLAQEDRFFTGGVTTADDGDGDVWVEGTVTGGTGSEAMPNELFLVREPEMTRRRSCGNNDAPSLVGLLSCCDDEGVISELLHLGRGDIFHAGAEAFGLLLHLHHELWAHDPFWKTWEVLDFSRSRKLPPNLITREDEGLQIGASDVDSGGPTGTSGSNDDHVFHMAATLVSSLKSIKDAFHSQKSDERALDRFLRACYIPAMRLSLPKVICLTATCLLSTGCLRKEQPVGFRIAVIPQKTSTGFWRAVHGGAIKAERELEAAGFDVDIHWRGPTNRHDAIYQGQLLSNFVSNRISGIVLAPSDPDLLVNSVSEAMGAEIPVMIIDAPINTEEFVGSVRTGQDKAGQLAGNHLAKLIKEKGTVAIIGSESSSANEQAREQGALKTLDALESVVTLPAKNETAEDVQRKLVAGEIDAVFCLTPEITDETLVILRQAALSGGRVKVVGWDLTDSAVDDLATGDLQALVVQDPLQMGYLAVLGVVGYLSGKPLDKEVDTGAFLVTRESMLNVRIKELLNPPVEELLKTVR